MIDLRSKKALVQNAGAFFIMQGGSREDILTLRRGGERALFMQVVGVTGRIASGKSTVAKMLGEKGALVIDADQIAREQTEVGKPVYKDIVRHFGDSILNSDDIINRRQLGRIVFSDPVKLKTLNRITHGPIIQEIKRRIRKIKQTGDPKQVVVIDVPLLTESGLDSEAGLIIVVIASRTARLERLKSKGFSHDEALDRLKAQIPDEKRFSYADHVVENNGTLDELQAEVERVWQKLK